MLSSKIFSLGSFDGKKYANESKGKFGFNVINILTKTVFMASLHDESNFNCFRHESFHSSLFYHCVSAEKNRWNLRLRTPLRNLSSEFFTPTIGGDSSGLLESFCGWKFWFTKALGWRERIFLFGDYFSTNLNVEISSVKGSVKGWQYSLITICSKIFLIRLLIIDVHCSTSCRKIPPAYTRVKLCKYLLLLLSRITS